MDGADDGPDLFGVKLKDLPLVGSAFGFLKDHEAIQTGAAAGLINEFLMRDGIGASLLGGITAMILGKEGLNPLMATAGGVLTGSFAKDHPVMAFMATVMMVSAVGMYKGITRATIGLGGSPAPAAAPTTQ